MKYFMRTAVVVLIFIHVSWAQTSAENVDTAMISRIKVEGLQHSHSIEMLDWLTNVYGSRLTGSPEHKAAADWAVKTLDAMGLQNVHLEAWGPFGTGWTLKHFSFSMDEPKTIPLIGYPKAWSPSTNGRVKGGVVYLHANTPEELAAYRGTLKGKFVLLDSIRPLAPNFKPNASRHSDETLLKLANADVPTPRSNIISHADSVARLHMREETILLSAKLELCRTEGALAILDCSHGDGGTVYCAAASVPQPEYSTPGRRVNAYDEDAPAILPQISVTAEHYNRIHRILLKGLPVTLELNLNVETSPVHDSWNVIGEIPGTDLKDEIVMVGGHFDSWHAGSGAADNGAGAIASMEAMRILRTVNIKPRRTIRVALWSGEEQGLLGSRAYVSKYFGTRGGDWRNPTGPVVKKEDYEKLSVYFNNDYGGGKIRGIYTQGNDALRPIFRAWMESLRDLGVETITPVNAGGTDHLTFEAIGLPGFQFIVDPIEYGRTYHSNMDAFERVIEGDAEQAATVMAAFVYDAAMRDAKLPRKPLPQ
jgi:carboxypeptidase Q